MTAKEIFLELLKPDGRPERRLVQYEALQMALGDPVGRYLSEGMMPGATITNRWGTVIEWPADAPGPMPHVTEETKVIRDITRWRDYVRVPDIAAACSDRTAWDEYRDKVRAKAGDRRLVTAFMPTGIFEQCHSLMTFQEVLTNLYDHPQEMHDLIELITECRICYARMLIENLRPDVLFTHDDWGTKDALFMKPDMWRAFFREPYRRFYGYIRSEGVITVHHADSYLAPIVEDMAEIGIQVWQGVLPENDIPALQARLKGSMVLMGGIGASIDREDAGEEEVRAYVKKALREYCPGGHFIPCITYGLPGAVYRHIDPWIDDEIERYNAVWHLQACAHAHVRASDKTPAVILKRDTKDTEKKPSQDESLMYGSSAALLAGAAEALQDGSLKQTVKAVRRALDHGLSAQDILDKGLIQGMNRLGEDFSAGEVFVPEMLRAANCMSGAMEILIPLIAKDAGSGPSGRVCLGTVRGDLHDIGKNLVRIMMEGAGLEVVDLGCDVSAEDFVQAAMDNDCDMIACSALLTTSMGEMERVVRAAEEKGIRDRVKILVGGAPVSQEFCDRIGADCYTPDAAAAARAAVRLLSQR